MLRNLPTSSGSFSFWFSSESKGCFIPRGSKKSENSEKGERRNISFEKGCVIFLFVFIFDKKKN